MHIFAGFQRAEPQPDGTLTVYGVASAPVRDAHGEIVTRQAMADAIDEYMQFPAVREQHDPYKAAGTGVDISIDEHGRTVFVAKIVDKSAIEKVKQRVYRGYSIGGKIKQRNPQDHSIISKIELQEISLVDRPSCPAATLDLWKRDDVTDLRKEEAGDDSFVEWKDKDRWNDGFDFFGEGADAGSSEGPMSVTDGGPYRQQTPVNQADGGGQSSTEWQDKDKWHDGREFFGQGGDAGRASFVTDVNAGQVRVGGSRNSTVNTAQQRSDTGDRASALPGSLPGEAGNSSSRREGGASPSSDYFTPAPGTNANIQRLFEMIGEMYNAQKNPPVHDAQYIVQKGGEKLVDNVTNFYAENSRPPADAAPYLRKRAFTAEQRKAAAKSGAAMPDGSYPIHNRDDLANAIRAIGRSKNPGATKTHIKRRAASLGAGAMVPADWKSAETEGGLNNQQRTPANIDRIDGNNDSLATKLSKTDDIMAATIASIEKMEVRLHRGHATPEAYRLAKHFQAMPLDELAEVLALDTMANIARNNAQLTTAEGLAKQYKADNDSLLKKLEDTQKGLESLAARVQKLADMPMQLKTAGSVHALDKEGDASGVRSFTERDLDKARITLDGMSDEERVMLLTKMALSHPRKMNLNPQPNPPRSVGGTAGGREEIR